MLLKYTSAPLFSSTTIHLTTPTMSLSCAWMLIGRTTRRKKKIVFRRTASTKSDFLLQLLRSVQRLLRNREISIPHTVQLQHYVQSVVQHSSTRRRVEDACWGGWFVGWWMNVYGDAGTLVLRTEHQSTRLQHWKAYLFASGTFQSGFPFFALCTRFELGCTNCDYCAGFQHKGIFSCCSIRIAF